MSDEPSFLITQGQRERMITSQFYNGNTGHETNWTFHIERRGDELILGMYWGDKEDATYYLNVSREAFINAVKELA